MASQPVNNVSRETLFTGYNDKRYIFLLEIYNAANRQLNKLPIFYCLIVSRETLSA